MPMPKSVLIAILRLLLVTSLLILGYDATASSNTARTLRVITCEFQLNFSARKIESLGKLWLQSLTTALGQEGRNVRLPRRDTAS